MHNRPGHACCFWLALLTMAYILLISVCIGTPRNRPSVIMRAVAGSMHGMQHEVRGTFSAITWPRSAEY